MTDARDEAPPGWPLGVARIVVGFLWFQQLLWKLPPDFGCTAARDQGLCDWLGRVAKDPPVSAFGSLVSGVLLPNLGVFGWLIFVVEAVVAFSLLLGLFTWVGGLLGALQALTIGFSLLKVPHEWYWSYVMLALLCALFALTGAGRWLGVDGWRRGRTDPRGSL